MRSAAQLAEAQRLVVDGLNDCEISRQTRIPRSTVRDWRRAGFKRSRRRRGARASQPHIHDFSQLSRSYAYLLGVYLGDGCISRHARGVHRLRITLDLRYPLIISACREAMTEVMPTSRASVQLRRDGKCVEVNSYSTHRPCLISQHGPGRKHTRAIVLLDWQRAICDQAPAAAPGAHPLRRVPADQPREGHRHAVRVSALHVHQPLRRHPPRLL